MYYLSKYYELLDTVLQLLKGRPPPHFFLHVYHHATVLLRVRVLTWRRHGSLTWSAEPDSPGSLAAPRTRDERQGRLLSARWEAAVLAVRAWHTSPSLQPSTPRCW